MTKIIDDYLKYFKIHFHMVFHLGNMRRFKATKEQKIFMKEVVELYMWRGYWWDIVDYPTDGTTFLLKDYGISENITKRENYKGRKEIRCQNEKLRDSIRKLFKPN